MERSRASSSFLLLFSVLLLFLCSFTPVCIASRLLQVESEDVRSSLLANGLGITPPMG
nr:TPA_asm: hypothetical protein HUJ06_011585 [Nelumbo nucifera]